MNKDELTIGEFKELTAMLGGPMFGGKDKPSQTSAYEIGENYLFRTVTQIITGKLVRIHPDGLVVVDAAWIADTGRFSNAIATCDFSEVEPYPDGREVVINFLAITDAVTIETLPRTQK